MFIFQVLYILQVITAEFNIVRDQIKKTLAKLERYKWAEDRYIDQLRYLEANHTVVDDEIGITITYTVNNVNSPI